MVASAPVSEGGTERSANNVINFHRIDHSVLSTFQKFYQSAKKFEGAGLRLEAEPQQLDPSKLEGDTLFTGITVPKAKSETAPETKPEQAPEPTPTPKIDPIIPEGKIPPELDNPEGTVAINYVKANPVHTVLLYRHLLNNYNSERLFNSIYGTQINLLQFMDSNSGGTELRDMMNFHTKHQQLAKRTDYSLQDYIKFLADFGAIEPKKSSFPKPPNTYYAITEFGHYFLNYIRQQYPMAWFQRMY